jgi:phosphoglycolate phosphatase-like HAD superfamily hydrolase
MHYVFDLDGTLVDTKELVRAAYKRVGVTPPDDFFGKSWREWLKDEKLHQKKNQVYAAMMPGHLKALPLMSLYRTLMSAYENDADQLFPPYVLTGASAEAAKNVFRVLGIKKYLLIPEQTISMKIDWMNKHAAQGIMFEDNQDHATLMRIRTKWTIVLVQ